MRRSPLRHRHPRLRPPSARRHPRRRASNAVAATLTFGSVMAAIAGIEPARAESPLAVRSSGASGILLPGEPIRFDAAGCGSAPVDWSVTDSDGRATDSGRLDGAAGERVLAPTAASMPGVYRLRVTCDGRSGSTLVARSSGPPAVVDPMYSLAVSGSPGPASSALPTFTALGGGSYRQDLQWQTVEKRPGTFDFSSVDARVDAWVGANGIAPLFILDYGNTAYTGGGMHPPDVSDPVQRAGWERFVQTSVTHMRARYPEADLSYEVWNEWTNVHGSLPDTPQAYVALAEVTFQAVRSADPSARVVGPAANAVSVRERDWLRGWFAAGGARYVDAISVHPYSEPWAPEECVGAEPCIESALAWLRDQARANPGPDGHPVPVWITEVGWPTANRNAVLQGDLAAYLVRTNVLAARAGVERVYTFEMAVPDGIEPDGTRRAFGLVDGVETGYAPKLAAAAWLTMQRQLAGMRFAASWDSADGSVRQTRFDSPDGRRHVRVVWQTTERFATKQVTVALPGGGTIVEPYGASKTVAATGGTLEMTARWSPRFVVWTD